MASLAGLRGLAPTRIELLPWTDRKGRFDRLRFSTFLLLLAPVAWLAVRWVRHDLGPEPVNAAIHSTGYWTIWLLLASLTLTPAKVVAMLPNIVVLRRMVGNAALLYAVLHIILYATDQQWRVLTIVSEIVKRFYLTIGFVALLGLVVLGFTSTDAWLRHLGKNWKRLHRVVYVITVLGLMHYILQSKLDVSQALLAGGVFTWLMLWRRLPAGPDRFWLPLLGIALAAAALTLGYEYGWYRYGTRIDPMKVVRGEFDVGFGLHPAGQVLALGVVTMLGLELRRAATGRWGEQVWFTMVLYALGALVAGGLAAFLGWQTDDAVDGAPAGWVLVGAWAVLLGVLGVARWRMQGSWHRLLVDVVWLACVVYQVTRASTGDSDLGLSCAALLIGLSLLLGQRVWQASRAAAVALVPFGFLLAYGAVAYL